MSEPSDRDEHERERRRLERVVPELIKRAIETGYEKLAEGPENVRQFVSELKLPKEALALVLAQIEESKNGLYRAVAREVRDFLDKTNLSEELVKVLTGLSFEIRTEIRFVPNDARPGARPKPDVQSKVSLKRSPSSNPPPSTPRPSDAPEADASHASRHTPTPADAGSDKSELERPGADTSAARHRDHEEKAE